MVIPRVTSASSKYICNRVCVTRLCRWIGCCVLSSCTHICERVCACVHIAVGMYACSWGSTALDSAETEIHIHTHRDTPLLTG